MVRAFLEWVRAEAARDKALYEPLQSKEVKPGSGTKKPARIRSSAGFFQSPRAWRVLFYFHRWAKALEAASSTSVDCEPPSGKNGDDQTHNDQRGNITEAGPCDDTPKISRNKHFTILISPNGVPNQQRRSKAKPQLSGVGTGNRNLMSAARNTGRIGFIDDPGDI